MLIQFRNRLEDVLCFYWVVSLGSSWGLDALFRGTSAGNRGMGKHRPFIAYFFPVGQEDQTGNTHRKKYKMFPCHCRWGHHFRPNSSAIVDPGSRPEGSTRTDSPWPAFHLNSPYCLEVSLVLPWSIERGDLALEQTLTHFSCRL